MAAEAEVIYLASARKLELVCGSRAMFAEGAAEGAPIAGLPAYLRELVEATFKGEFITSRVACREWTRICKTYPINGGSSEHEIIYALIVVVKPPDELGQLTDFIRDAAYERK